MRLPIILIILLTLSSFLSYAQVESQVKTPDALPYKSDTTIVSNDSIPAPSDSTIVESDSVSIPKKKDDIETTIKYSAKDSIRASMVEKKVWLYGQASITYGEIKLDAEEIEIDYEKSTLTAIGKRDSTGKVIGYPIFQNGSELYETHDIIYNFKTQNAKISQVRTKQGESIMSVQSAFKNEKNELFSRNNTYTTCDLEHPHFLIRSTKSKAIPNDKIVSGPFYFEFNDIPLPIGFLFGMFPAKRESSSGIIFPSYGEERRRGFNLRNFGYFFDINDYIKLALTGDIYSKGGHAVYVNSNYMKRYKYSGSFNFSYSKTKTSDKIENPTSTNDYRIAWSHSPKSKGNSRFSASVNAATSTYNQNNNLNYGYNTSINSTGYNNTTAKLSSTLSYSKKFEGTPFSLGINGSINQDLKTKLVDLPFPNITLNMTNQYPFQRKDGNTGPLDNFSIGYSMAATNRITNNIGKVSPEATTDSIAPFTIENLPYFIDHARNGIKHAIPISTSNKLFRYFTVSPSINYDERWYFEKLTWRYQTQNDKQVLVADTTSGFNRIA
ncbi:MAG TPA: putative LPS assembly protein LptD, partial [Cyclobacteriaceae bacterium]|nr:putative LPS assembly protein LptD [Cyclobacteriaceae bacterium]